MKKLVYIFVLLISFCDQIQSQSEIKTDTIWVNGVPKITRRKVPTASELYPSPLKKDDYLFEVSYGYPFNPVWEAGFFGGNNTFFSGTRTKNITKNTNHLCLRTDYQLNEEFSVGLEFTYATISFDYYRSYSVFSGTSTVTYKDSLFKASATKIRFLAKIGYHFNISEKFDAYGTMGFGLKQFTYSTSDSYLSSNASNTGFPMAIRLSVGGRFFLTDNAAIHVEGGVGGPMMQVGITYKMH